MSETQMDWQQVALNGGPPCFALGIDAPGWYCGRAQRWDGHDYDHKFVSLDDLLNAERERCAKIAEKHRADCLHCRTALTIADEIRGSKQ